MKTIIVAALAATILSVGFILEYLCGKDHFSRSGSLLVIFALLLSLYREQKIKRYDTQHIDNVHNHDIWKDRLLDMRFQYNLISVQKDIGTQILSVYSILAKKLTLTDDKKLELDHIESDVYSKFNASTLAGKDLDKEGEDLRNELAAIRQNAKLRHKELKTRANNTFTVEIIVASVGTLVWGYGDLLFPWFLRLGELIKILVF